VQAELLTDDGEHREDGDRPARVEVAGDGGRDLVGAATVKSASPVSVCPARRACPDHWNGRRLVIATTFTR